MLAAFLRTLGTLEGIDLLPASEVDRLDTTFRKQAVDGFWIAIGGHASALGGLGQILQHVGDDQQRVGLGGADQAHRTALGPTGGIQALTHLNILTGFGSRGDTAITMGIGQVRTALVMAMPGAVAGL